MRYAIIVLIYFLNICVPAFANDYKAETERAERLGELIYKHDIAAWVATDAMLADKAFTADDRSLLKGWLSFPDGKKMRTVFIGGEADNLRVYYVAVNKKRKIKTAASINGGRALTQAERGLWVARETMLSQKFEICKDYLPMNSIIFQDPDNDDGRILGYLFSATQKNNLIVLGKHYRFLLTPDGRSVTDTHAFSKSCFALSSGEVPRDAKIISMFASHIMANFPEEHHVFASLSRGIDLYVSTPDQNLWLVSGDDIENKGKLKPSNRE